MPHRWTGGGGGGGGGDSGAATGKPRMGPALLALLMREKRKTPSRLSSV